MSNSLWPHGLQHARPPCPSPTPGACSNSYPSSQWCHQTISSSVVPFSSSFQSFSASGSFPMNQFLASGGQSIGASASASVLPMNIQGWFPLRWTSWISLQSKGLSRVFSNNSLKASILRRSASFMVQLSHPYTTTGGTTAQTRRAFVGTVTSLLLRNGFTWWFPANLGSQLPLPLDSSLSQLLQQKSQGPLIWLTWIMDAPLIGHKPWSPSGGWDEPIWPPRLLEEKQHFQRKSKDSPDPGFQAHKCSSRWSHPCFLLF